MVFSSGGAPLFIATSATQAPAPEEPPVQNNRIDVINVIDIF